MGFVDPNTLHNPSTGGVPPATWGDQVRDNDVFLYSGKGSVKATNTTTYSHSSSGAWRNPTFDTETYDSGASALHSTAGNTDRITIVDAGLYAVHATALWDTNSTGSRAIGFDLNSSNGSGLTASMQSGAASTLGARQTVTHFARFAAADIIRCAVYQDSGGTRTVTPTFTAVWLGG